MSTQANNPQRPRLTAQSDLLDTYTVRQLLHHEISESVQLKALPLTTKVAANQPVTDGKTLEKKFDLRSWEKVSLLEEKKS